MRRTPTTRPENQLAWALAEIERLKSLTTRITDGRSVVLVPGDPGVGDVPPIEGAPHTLYGTKHTRSLAVTAAAGVSLNVSIEQGQVWVNGVFFSIAATTLLMVNAATNFVFVNNAGVVTSNTTGFPLDGIPLATVVTAGGDITSVNDRRAYLNAGSWTSMSGILTTRGDLLTRDATQLIRLGIGAAGSILRSDGLDPAWTINPTIAGYMRLGATAAPANVTAGDLTFIRGFINDDSNYRIEFVGANPRITFDTGDFLEFQRAENLWNNLLGAAGTWQVQIAGAVQIIAGTSQVQLLGDTTSFDSTGIIQIGNDTNFTAQMVGANPRFTLDVGDFLEYNRVNNDFVLTKGAAAPAQLRFTIDARAQSGASAVLYFIGQGAAFEGPAWFRQDVTDTRLKWSLETPNVAGNDPDLVLYRFTGAVGAEVRNEMLRFINADGNINYVQGGVTRVQFQPSLIDLPLGGAGGNFFIQFAGGGEPRINWDAGDIQEYVRATNFHVFRVANVDKLQVGPTLVQIGVDGSSPLLRLSAIDGVNAGGELQLMGAAAWTDWTFDNFAGTLRWHEGGAVDMELTDTGQLRLPIGGVAAGLIMGGDALLYRSAADTFRTPDSLIVDEQITIGTGNSVDNDILLLFSIDRAWQFEVDGEGVSTRLVLRELVNDKAFVIQSLDSTDVLAVFASDTDLSSTLTFTGGYFDSLIRATMPATPAANYQRRFPFTTTGRDVPFWRDDGGFQYAAPEKMRAFIPKPMLPTTGAGSTFAASTTTAAIGLVNIPSPIELTRLSYRVTVAGANVDNVMRFAIYSEDGQQKPLDVTHAVGTGTGEQTVTFAAVWLGPGNYYLFACLSSGTAPGPTFSTWTTDDVVFVAGAGGTEPDLEGNHTVVGGAAPATFDPLAITTPFRNSTLYCRLDGAA